MPGTAAKSVSLHRAARACRHSRAVNIRTMDELKIYGADTHSAVGLPFADEGVRAGFPSPAQDYMENSIDLNHDLVRHPESTFYARVEGDSMSGAGVFEGDLLVVDKAVQPATGDMAVCVLNGEFTVKFVDVGPAGVRLRPANDAYEPIRVEEGDSFEVWGVVTYVIHKVLRRK